VPADVDPRQSYSSTAGLVGDAMTFRFVVVPVSTATTISAADMILSLCDVSFRGKLHARPVQNVPCWT
jgi:hypothetical protein